MSGPRHVPVMLDRVVSLLAPALSEPGSVLVDATLGLGGHSEAVLTRLPQARVIGIDRDPDALAMSRERLAPFGDRFTGVHAVYDEIGDVLADAGLDTEAGVAGVLFDLGVSSMQLDVAERGFAYSVDAPLDMRMDGSTGPTAADVLNTYSAADLARVLKQYGEERMARRIADAVVRERAREPFTNSARLVELLYDVIPAPARRTGGHPAKRTFQALRMEVNDELRVLERAMPAAVAAIGLGGRVVVESYHSLEDRLVKRTFADAVRLDVPDDLPFVPEGAEPSYRLVTRGAEQADEAEIAENPRAASVRLRAIERVRPRGVGGDTSRTSKPSSTSRTSTDRETKGKGAF
ncbi:16S rRNA (cytosine(1402)-N(4))-methyltransferase RsmH [Nocardioides sp. zg-536]|uniref:Ribosomal RNA small subunit methyltransferase H n=1 Tax=Nocardioides faecalis TaxID=2803858 RepID=A0A938Y1J3_9ACTN|nr:16S rRNA (cytosine(1402)-N(4))-methyltransferase RsmH [Nocardioides faecalis]MBM9460472.1 16S rRNA (cytosine(1402)-N(4))-methyltransferase RsmH [Nocardioides faecalis]QVI57589.1 16S rRNA (cytosine(1402)-N(4))-methyltransferase RsmH [Nocardioides faecalis]